MEKRKLEHFKQKLLDEKKGINKLVRQLQDDEIVDIFSQFSSELSNYDNHPADTASELFEKEKGIALKEHEVTIIKKIEDALADIEKGTYGVCKECGEEILEERLEFIPYAQYCVHCQQKVGNNSPINFDGNRPVEEEVLGVPFGYGYNDNTDHVEFDAEDSYQAVARYNEPYFDVELYYEDDSDAYYVEPIEQISNEEYRNQLPD